MLAEVRNAIGKLLVDGGMGRMWTGDRMSLPDSLFALTAQVLPNGPDRAIAITPYPTEDGLTFDDDDGEVVLGVQLRFRGDKGTGSARDASDAAFDLLHGASHVPAGANTILLLTRASSAPMGADTAGRWQWSDTYTAVCYRA